MSTKLAEPDLYERDFLLWTRQQAAELRRAAEARVNLPLDFANLAEEIESLGRSDRRAIINHLAVAIEHLLKLEHSPAQQPRSGWKASVREARMQIGLILNDSPSLHSRLPELLGTAYPFGADKAAAGLRRYREAAAVPPACPYSLEQLLDIRWWPERRLRR